MAQTEKGWKDELKLSVSDYKYVILTVISGLILTFFLYISESFFTFIFQTTYEIPVWVISVFLILFFPLLIHFLYQISSHKDNSDVEVVDNPKEEITKKDYKTDIIYSVKWEWSWYGENISSLKLLCPYCQMELNLKSSIEHEYLENRLDLENVKEYKLFKPFVDVISYVECPKGDFKQVWVNKDDEDLKDQVRLEIERRVRTGEYLEAVEKYG